MSGDRQVAEEGLTVVGQVTAILPPARREAAPAGQPPFQTQSQEATWLNVRPDGGVTAYAGKVEYGQGIRSGLAIEVADELRVPLDSVEVILGDTARVPWDMGTFGSQSTARVGVQIRKAAATAREALLELAADRLDLPATELVCRAGRVESRHDADRGVRYGDLVAGRHLSRNLVEDIALTPANEFTVMGRPAQRGDAVGRVTGRAQFSQDIAVPGMLYAKVLRGPSYGAALVDVDSAMAERMPGVVQIARDGHLVAVLAETDEQAELASSVLRPQWEERMGQPSHKEVPNLLRRNAGETFVTQEAGSLDEGFSAADAVLEKTYYLPYVSNAPMEPRASVARWEDGRLTVWAGTQRPFGIRSELAQRFEMDENDVRVIAPEIGGGFGSKSLYPVAVEAARLARVAGRPVRVAYTREEEMMWATFRPAAVIEIKSGFKSDGTVVAWGCKGYFAGTRPFEGRRGSETPYDVAHVRVGVAVADSPLPAGSYRSLSGAVNHFAREVHMDEIAEAVGLDPVELRLRNLTHPRFRGVLEASVERFGWRPGKPPSKQGIGVALGLDVGSYAATCVQLDVQGTEVKVERVAVALDCGLTVNPDGAMNQVEGSIVMGMGTALYEEAEFQDGALLNASFARYRVPRINNAPAIDVVLVGKPEVASTGAGEPAIVPIAAAISNAVFDLTGKRHRELPIQRHLP